MADTKVSALPAVTSAALTDEFPVNQGGVSRKETNAQVRTLMQQSGMPRVTAVGSQVTNSLITGTEVTALQQTLEVGTFVFQYALIVRAAATATGVYLGVNYTGTQTKGPLMHFRFADATTAITAETHIMDNQGVLGFGYISGMAQNTESTTSPNMGTSVGVTATGTDLLCWIEGVLVTSSTGDLELWLASETAASQVSVEVGSSLIVTRTA
jgi:hypothetical protein